MIFRFLLLYVFLLLATELSSKTVGILCDDFNLQTRLTHQLSSIYRITNDFYQADVLVCGGEKYIKKCKGFHKKIVAVNIYSYQIGNLNSKYIVAYFPKDFRIEEVKKFIENSFRVKNKCVLTHYGVSPATEDLKIYRVQNIGEVPYILDKALKECDLIIGIPDDVVFNYFSVRFIFKKVILSGKMITGYSREMLKLGAVYSFEVDREKYVRSVVDFLKSYFNGKKLKRKVFYQSFSNFRVYKNSPVLKLLK